MPMEPAFSDGTRQVLLESARNLNIKCHEKGTSVVIEGPRFSSIAESTIYRSWGAQLVNMTLVPEVSEFDRICTVEFALNRHKFIYRSEVIKSCILSPPMTLKSQVYKFRVLDVTF